MAGKSDFTADEWNKLVESAMLAGIAVTAAEPSGLWGTLQEGFASARGLAEGRSSTTPLIKDIIADLQTSEGRTHARDAFKARAAGANAQEISRRALAGVADVARLVDAKAGADAAPFKVWIYENARRVAEASTEGGFLGFGGETISENERATLSELASTLGVAR